MPERHPTLVYDGDCGVCRYWVHYWQSLTGARVTYRPYQEAAADFPSIAPAEFARAIQLIEPDGAIYSGAAATFRTLREVPGRALWWWLYAHLPGFAASSERAYTFLSQRRGLLDRLSRFLWGPALEAERYELVSWLFLRCLGAIYVAAFASLSVQVLGLVGHDGILPAAEFLTAAHRALAGRAFYLLPTLFWFNADDAALLGGTFAGVLLGALVVINLSTCATRIALVGLFVLYLSYFYAGQDFLGFQWDLLLLETGFLSIFLTGGSRVVVWLFRWLAFRYFFLAGVVKLLSGDPTWRTMTALEYHFWSQPLPTPLAWYASQLPHWLLDAATVAALVTELGIVFLFFLPRRVRAVAAGWVLIFQITILLTGNYNFFNLLSMLLCAFLFDDAALRRKTPARLLARVQRRAPHPGGMATLIATCVALIVLTAGIGSVWETFWETEPPLIGSISDAISPVLIVNPYGLFAVMTTARPEIVIEGSADGEVWKEYVFKYKPGPVMRGLSWSIPHQPRLDWQMWFAATSDRRANPWFDQLVLRLLQGSSPVVQLLDSNPFPGEPPKLIRAGIYEYRFADRSLHAATGQWWVRRALRWYLPPVGLTDFSASDRREPVPPTGGPGPAPSY